MTTASIITETQDASQEKDTLSITAEKRDTKKTHIHNARKLMRQQHSGVLSTLSLSMKGFPFGSITPYLMTEEGDIVIYASDIAQHSRNMKVESKVSLCVHDAHAQDSQAIARVTLCAYAEIDAVDKDLQQAYFTLFPQAKAYVKAHDFRFYLLHVDRVRYIGGFGEIYWFSQEEWSESLPVSAQSKAAIEHMHADHADALADIVNAFAIKSGVNKGTVKMLTCYAEGFHYIVVRSTESDSDTCNRQFIPFLKEVNEDYSLRKAMVELTKYSR
ncbi:HugZ family protein [Agaribacter marinus]|uniref:DUF2470 domain-containing protein n=1 Tax=Agaribacter marinus TaxID=1431249 RepID=A0AA37SXQ4_9ALTE|nr:DUF2470 domain-containing protein [Agaribacter marinus]GLR71682.1 hypothetical protein GCM10007852_25900 [Agaribacter marinus]